MSCSKCDPPGRHLLEILSGNTNRDISHIGKSVYLCIYEKNNYGHEEWQTKHLLTIHPFKKVHWWEEDNCEFEFEECEFRFEISTK